MGPVFKNVGESSTAKGLGLCELYISKALDRVRHAGLLYKLKSY